MEHIDAILTIPAEPEPISYRRDPLQHTTDVCEEIAREVRRAVQLHKGMNSLHEAKAVIEEEFDEFWELVKVNPKKLDSEAQQRRMAELRNELIQTAAMCVRSIVDLKL